MSTTPVQKKILVVDDDKAVTTLLEGLLSAHGYACWWPMTVWMAWSR